MYCKKCGNKMIQGEKFCRACGNRIELNTSYQRKTEYKQNNRSYIPIVIFSVAFITIAILLVVVVTKNNNNSLDINETSNSNSVSSQYNSSLNANANSLFNSSYLVSSSLSSSMTSSMNSSNTSKKNTSSTSNKDFIIPDSSTRLLSTSDVRNLSNWEINLAINEIYARHGRKFDSVELQDYFSSKSWYRPSVNPSEFTTSMLSEIEMKNIDILAKYRDNN